MTLTNLDRYRGCLLGGAVGDALGYGVEFDRWPEIKNKHGEAGIREYAVHQWSPVGGISDDTQMTLFTAEGLLRAYTRFSMRGLTTARGVTEYAYLRWAFTQGHDVIDDIKDGWLLTNRELFARRAPGNTCERALINLNAHKRDGVAIVRNDSKGCGTVMRMAPVALFAHTQDWRDDMLVTTAIDLAEITHHHRTSSVASAAMVVLLKRILEGADKHDAYYTMLKFAEQLDGSAEFMFAAQGVDEALNDDAPTHTVIDRYWSGGWVAEEALLIACYAVLKSDDFDEILRIAVNHSGDSDSTGSIAGNIAGALYGAGAIDEERWLTKLELRDVIDEVAVDLANHREWEIDEYGESDEAILAKYPGW